MYNECFLKEAQEQNFWEGAVDYEELNAMRDDNEQFFECEFLPLMQVDIVDMLGDDEYANWAHKTCLPIPLENVAKLM
jgi:hypothetical protein